MRVEIFKQNPEDVHIYKLKLMTFPYESTEPSERDIYCKYFHYFLTINIHSGMQISSDRDEIHNTIICLIEVFLEKNISIV